MALRKCDLPHALRPEVPVVLAREPVGILLLAWAWWCIWPTAVVLICNLLRGDSLVWLWVVPVIPWTFYLGAVISHLRSRDSISITSTGIYWKAPSSWEWVGGIRTGHIPWHCVRGCRAAKHTSEELAGLVYDSIEVRGSRIVGHPPLLAHADTVVNEGERLVILGNESLTWTEQGKAFLEACSDEGGWRMYYKNNCS